MVEIPCGREFWPDPHTCTYCDARDLCHNCTALRGLTAACKMVLQRWSFSNDQRHTHTWHDMQDCAEVIRAALAAARPAGKEEK